MLNAPFNARNEFLYVYSDFFAGIIIYWLIMIRVMEIKNDDDDDDDDYDDHCHVKIFYNNIIAQTVLFLPLITIFVTIIVIR